MKKEKKPEIIVIGDDDVFVVINCQNDYTKPWGKFYVDGAKGEIGSNGAALFHIRELYRRFTRLVVVKESHPIEGYREVSLLAKGCIEKTNGEEFDSGIEEVINDADDEIIIGKDHDVIAHSISASPKFLKHIKEIREMGMKRIFLAGFPYTGAVGESAIDYARQGFKVYVIRDATRSLLFDNLKAMDEKLRRYCVKTVLFENIKR